MEKKKLTFKKSTETAFDSWAGKWSNGIECHPADDEFFYAFALEYYMNGEKMRKEDFVKKCKQYTHTTQRLKRGICQKYYERLNTIVYFLKWNSKNQ